MRSRNWVLFLFVVFVWASGWSVLKVALTYVDPLNLALQRFALSALALSPLLIHIRKRVRMNKRAAMKLLLLGAVNTSAVVPLYWGMVYETSGVGAVLTYTQPLFVFCLSVLFLKSQPRPARLLGALVGFSGVIALSIGRAGSIQVSASTGDVLLLLGAALWAIAVVYYKKSLSDVDPRLVSVVQQALGAAILLPLTVSVQGLYFPLAQPYVMMILYLSVFGSGLTVFLWLYLVREEDVTVLSLSSFLIPMIAVFLGWLLLSESIQPISLIGIAMIITALYLTNTSRFS